MMMEQFLTNRIIIGVLLAVVGSQSIKLLITIIRKKKIDMTLLWDTGGMPSSHAALATSLALAVYIEEGLTTLSIVTFFLCMIVIRDAFGHRRQTGMQARVLNRIITDLKLQKKLNISKLKELVGHNFSQVSAGILLGIISIWAVFKMDLNSWYYFSHFWIITGLTTIYYVLPGLVANMMPIFVRNHFNFLAIPVDLGMKMNNKRVFGSHKTIRGFLSGMVGGVITTYVQFLLRDNPYIKDIMYIDYTLKTVVFVGISFSFFALLGDSIESFFKRQLGIEPGQSFFPFDQIDFILGIIFVSFFIKPMNIYMIIFLIFMGPILSILATRTGHALRLRKQKW